MPTTVNGLTFYNDFIEDTAMERLYQNVQGFNANVDGAMVLDVAAWSGRSRTETYLKRTSNFIQRRDPTSTGTFAASTMANAEQKTIKVYRKAAVTWTRQDWLDQGMATTAGQEKFAQQVGDDILKDMYDTAAAALVGANLKNGTATNFDATALTDKWLQFRYLGKAFKKMGDQSSLIRALLIHSTPYHDLMEDFGITQSYRIGDLVVNGVNIKAAGKLQIVSDIPALAVDAASSLTDYYYTLGLVENAVTISVNENEQPFMTFNQAVGTPGAVNENMTWIGQMEYAFSIKVKGMTYSSATDNPTNASLATSTPWTLVAADRKGGPGVMIKTYEKTT